jgi:hypothetical protein
MMIDDGPAGLMTDDFLVMLIKSQTGGRSWETNPRAALSLRNGLLTVTQTPAVQREIEALVARLPF